MKLRLHKLLIPVATMLAFLPAVVAAQQGGTDPLKPYTACKVPGDLRIKEVTRRNTGNQFREVITDSGKEKVSVVDGYRVMFAYPDLTYYFAQREN